MINKLYLFDLLLHVGAKTARAMRKLYPFNFIGHSDFHIEVGITFTYRLLRFCDVSQLTAVVYCLEHGIYCYSFFGHSSKYAVEV